MKPKGFTLIELLTTLVIVAVVAVLIAGFYSGISSDEDVDYSFIHPQLETARSQRRMADELTRQNDLMERHMELLESQSKKGENK
jgi:prepilin-type N-terminal cleavage/methylation domain-containing protein